MNVESETMYVTPPTGSVLQSKVTVFKMWINVCETSQPLCLVGAQQSSATQRDKSVLKYGEQDVFVYARV